MAAVGGFISSGSLSPTLKSQKEITSEDDFFHKSIVNHPGNKKEEDLQVSGQVTWTRSSTGDLIQFYIVHAEEAKAGFLPCRKQWSDSTLYYGCKGQSYSKQCMHSRAFIGLSYQVLVVQTASKLLSESYVSYDLSAVIVDSEAPTLV